MNRLDMIKRVRNNTRDLSNSIFRELDIVDYLNEGINRIKQVIPSLRPMTLLTSNDSIPTLLPEEYHDLIAMYSTSRCFNQDERHYQATNFMNEFEQKLDELKQAVESGDVVVEGASSSSDPEYVKDTYFTSSLYEVDNGVEGVE